MAARSQERNSFALESSGRGAEVCRACSGASRRECVPGATILKASLGSSALPLGKAPHRLGGGGKAAAKQRLLHLARGRSSSAKSAAAARHF